jgi:hypothetical protein
MEMECDRIAQTSAFNPYSARLDIIRSQRVNSREVEALTAKAAAWTAPVVAPDSSVNHFASAIASLEAKPGNTPAERASTQRQVDLLRTAESKWLDEQAREAAAEARAARPEYINAVENSAAVAAYLANVATAPQSLVTAAHERAKALKASGDVDAYWRDTRAAEKALDQHYTDIENKFDEEKKQHEADKAAALSRLPVAPVVEAPPPTPSVIESTLMGGSISPEVTT